MVHTLPPNHDLFLLQSRLFGVLLNLILSESLCWLAPFTLSSILLLGDNLVLLLIITDSQTSEGVLNLVV